MAVWQLVIEIILVVLGVYLSFFKSYMNEKGKNLATQEDIGNITAIVEGIKKDLNDETELLKSKLSLYNQNRFSIKSAERNAMFTINKTYSGWINSLMHFSLISYDETNIEEINEMILQFNKKRLAFEMAKSHASIFINDIEYYEIIKNVTVETLALERIVATGIRKYRLPYILYKIKKNVTPVSDLLNLYQSLIAELDPISQSLYDDRINQFTVTHVQEIKLTSYIKRRIETSEG